MKRLKLKKLEGREAKIGFLTILGFIGLLLMGIVAGVLMAIIWR